MATQPITAGRTGPALPLEVEAGSTPGAGPAGTAGAAGKAESRRTGPAKPAAPSAARSPAKLGKTVDKALGKVKPPKTAAPGAKPAGSQPARTTSGYASGAGTAKPATGEWAFLQDKNLSIEEKLFRYLLLLQKKADAELQQFMEGTSGASKGGSSSSKGTSLFDVAKAVVPALGLAESLIGEAGLKKLATQLAGPVLAAAATAAGMPVLAPVALQLGNAVAQLAFEDVGGRAASSSSTSAPIANEYSRMSDQQKSIQLQHLLEKQKAMFAAISNTLRCMHDTQMAAIQNIR